MNTRVFTDILVVVPEVLKIAGPGDKHFCALMKCNTRLFTDILMVDPEVLKIAVPELKQAQKMSTFVL